MMTDRQLMDAAKEALTNSYAPYSGFNVGAALMSDDGQVYTGCNVENAAFSPGICAERAAFAKAVGSGKRKFLKIAVAGGKNGKPGGFCPPCGVCRQVMAEFCGGEFEIILENGGELKALTLSELLPYRFGKENVGGGDTSFAAGE